VYKYMKRILASFKYAIEGLQYALISQRNLKIHFGFALVVLFLSWFLKVSTIEFILLIISISIVIICEMINTAIETTIDLITKEYHPLAKIAKNVAAGSVLISAIMSIMVGCLIFFDKIIVMITAVSK
jgi:diacylglycerol kinase (ATP)